MPQNCSIASVNRPVAQIPHCTSPISHNAPFCNRNVHISVTKWSGLPRSGKSQGNSSLSQSQGKVREFCCKSGNFVICYQSQGKVREFNLWSLSMLIFHCFVNDIWTRTKSWITSSFKCHSAKIFSEPYLFSCFVLCSAQDIDNFHDDKNVLLCWPIFRTTMLKHLLMHNCDFYVVLNMFAKNHHSVYIITVTGICVGSQGNVREKSGNFFLPTPWQPWWCIVV